MTKRRASGQLAVRQALIAALCGLVFGVVFSAFQISFDYAELAEDERRAIAQTFAVMREPAAQACYQLSEQAATVVVNGTLVFSPVREAVLRNDFGETLARGSNQMMPTAADAWWTRFVPPSKEYTLSLEVGPAKKRVGELTVVADRGVLIERFLDGVWPVVGLSIARSVIVAFALGVLMYVTLARPLVAIAERIRLAAAPGARGPLPEAERADEVGEIAEAFERYEREARERTRRLESSAQALSASEARYRRVVETAGEGVWQVDADGMTTLANEAMAQMLGTTAVALVGRSMFDFMDAEGCHVAGELLRSRRRGGGSGRRDFRFVRADGRELWAELSTCSIVDAEGRPAGALAMVTDATERHQRDDELRATNMQLRAMVGDLERHKRDMAQIAELNELLQSAGNEAEAFDVIRATATRLFADGAGALSVAGSGDEMVRVGAWGEAKWIPLRFSREVCWAIRRGSAHEQSPAAGVHCAHHQIPPEAALCLPLYVEGQLLGVLHVSGSKQGGIDDALRQRTEIFGAVIKLGLSNLRLRESLRQQAVRDPLTGMPNRRMFDETLPRELARCFRSGQPLTVAVIDVDHFKHFNDTYGHDAGDRVLRAVGAALTRSIRSADMACRYGGDEFLCLMAGMTAAEAKARFDRVLVDNGVGEHAELPEPVTFTVGLATAPDCATDVAGLQRAADAALYEAKMRGRNCVAIAPVRPNAAALAVA